MAAFEYLNEFEYKDTDFWVQDLNDRISRTGALTCYCKDAVENKGLDTSVLKNFCKGPSCKIFKKVRICKERYERIGSFQVGYFAAKSFGALITLANFCTRLIMIALTKLIRCSSVSREARFIRNSVFVMSFFNTGLLYMFASISTRTSRLPFIKNTLEGVYPDFNAYWYEDIG